MINHIEQHNNNEYCDEFGVRYTSNRKCLISAPSDLKEYAIPYGVERIREKAFYNNLEITSISIPETVIKIGAGAFSSCLALKEFKFNSPHFTYDNGVLYSKKKQLLICFMPAINNSPYFHTPNEVKIIGKNAFSNCLSLKNLTITDGVLYIRQNAFSCCANLEEINLPNYLEIKCHAFFRCEKLHTINIPKRTITVAQCAFMECEALDKSIIKSIAKEESLCDFILSKNTDEHIVFRKGTKRIRRKEMILYDENTVSITIPESVTIIDEGAFHNYRSLETLIVHSPHFVFEDGALYNADKTVLISVLQGIITYEDFEIPSTVHRIGSHSFFGVDYVESVIVPNSVTSIGCEAFSRCTALEEIYIPESVTLIEADAFNWCWRLINISLPKGCLDIIKELQKSGFKGNVIEI